jgi:hypothetical protein
MNYDTHCGTKICFDLKFIATDGSKGSTRHPKENLRTISNTLTNEIFHSTLDSVLEALF